MNIEKLAEKLIILKRADENASIEYNINGRMKYFEVVNKIDNFKINVYENHTQTKTFIVKAKANLNAVAREILSFFKN